MTEPEAPASALHQGTGAQSGSGPSSVGAGAWVTPRGALALDRPRIMGVVNLTPDSFSDGGRYPSVETALAEAEEMVAAGADVIDVGGESTRPGAEEVSEAEELARVLPFVEAAAAGLGVPVSVDTRKATVARACLAAGAAVVNDVSGLGFDQAMGDTVAAAGAGLVLMHMRGVPANMRSRARYGDVVREVADELARAVERARAAGVRDEAIVVDPGLGFAKDAHHSLALLANLGPVRELGFPVLVGPSRKSFIGDVTGAPPPARAAGTSAACVAAYFQGARIFRVHDVAPVAQALAVAAAIEAERGGR